MQACEPRVTGPAGPRKDNAPIIPESSAVLVWIPSTQHTQNVPRW